MRALSEAPRGRLAESATFNFVVRNELKWACLGTNCDLDPDRLPALFASNEDVWVVLTCLRLGRRGLRFTVSRRPVPGAINIVDGIKLEPADSGPDIFLVGCRGDGHYPALCQIVLQQNTIRQAGAGAIYVPQWPQPGIICRNAHRRKPCTLGFFGHAAVNLDGSFHDRVFADRIASRGYELIIHDKDDAPCWHDYSKIDLTLSVRNIPYAHLRLKPANKLINSWHAGAPAIIGPEPAVQALRRSRLDYFEVRRPEQVLDVLASLESRPEIYRSMVEHGRARALRYTNDAVSVRWFRALESIQEFYIGWKRLRTAERDLAHAARLDRHARALRKHERDVHRAYWKAGFDRQWWDTRLPPVQRTSSLA